MGYNKELKCLGQNVEEKKHKTFSICTHTVFETLKNPKLKINIKYKDLSVWGQLGLRDPQDYRDTLSRKTNNTTNEHKNILRNINISFNF